MQVTPKQAESFTDTIKEAVKKTESTVLDFLIDNNLISGDALNKYTEFKYGDTGYDPNAKGAEDFTDAIRGKYSFNKGGMPTQMKMSFMDDGGLKDDGGEVEPTSGNDVPSGSLKEEVKDDIPTMLSEGEFVFPADVVRYIGLEKLMVMRQEAKMGLKRMEAMGQMGDEPTIPDDLPFGMADLVVIAGGKEEDGDEPREMNTGGMSTQFRTLSSPQAVPIRSGRRNIAMPTTPLINPDGTMGDTTSTTTAKQVLSPEVPEAPKVEAPVQETYDAGDEVGSSAQSFDPLVNDPRGSGFNAYDAEDWLSSADSQNNTLSKLLAFTPISILGSISNKSGISVAKKALETGVMPATKVEMDNFFTGEKGRTVGGKKLTAFDKVALAKYLTAERPTNSILESVGKLVGSVFSPTDEKAEVKNNAEAAEIAKILEKAGVQLSEGGGIKIDGVPYADFDDDINKLRKVHYAQRDDLEYNEETGEITRTKILDEYGNDVGKRFQTHGITTINGRSIMYRGDAHGVGHRGSHIFHVDDPKTGKRKFFSIDQLERLGIQTTGLGATERILRFLSKVDFETLEVEDDDDENGGLGGGTKTNDPSTQLKVGDTIVAPPAERYTPNRYTPNPNLNAGKGFTVPQDPSEVSTDFKADVVPAPMYPPSDPSTTTPSGTTSNVVKDVTPPVSTSTTVPDTAGTPQGPEGLLPQGKTPPIINTKAGQSDPLDPQAGTLLDPNFFNKDVTNLYKESTKQKEKEEEEEQQIKAGQLAGKGYVGGKGFKSGGLAKMKTKPTKKRKGGLASKKK